MANENQQIQSDLPSLTTSDASRLLALGLCGPRRPVDDLIDRLCLSDGSEWLARSLATGPAGAFGDPVVYLVEGQATLDQLLAAKQSSKTLMSAAGPARLTALASYLLTVAAGFVHYKTNICSRSQEEIDEVLLDLAAVTAEPWTTLLAAAATADVL